jgi:hypothetical protein
MKHLFANEIGVFYLHFWKMFANQNFIDDLLSKWIVKFVFSLIVVNPHRILNGRVYIMTSFRIGIFSILKQNVSGLFNWRSISRM